MIQFFIKMSNSVIGKVIFLAIFLGMVFVLGIGGITEMNRSPDDAIRVGNKKLTMRQLDEVFKQETRKLSAIMGGQLISPAQAVEMGLLENVVRQQTNDMIMVEVKKELGLTASNASVQKYVERNPAFADATGKFDRNLFLAYLRQSGLSEKALAQKLQDELAAQHLINAIQRVSFAPNQMAKLAYKYQNEKRSIAALHVEIDKIAINNDLSYPIEGHCDDNQLIVECIHRLHRDEGHADADEKRQSSKIRLHLLLEAELCSLTLGLVPLLFKIAVNLVGKTEYLLKPEYRGCNKHDPAVQIEAAEGYDIETEDYCRYTDASADDDRGDEPAELHSRCSCYHNERIVREDGEQHHNGEINRSSCAEQLKGLLTVFLTEHLLTQLISAESAEHVEHGAGDKHAGVGEKKRHPDVVAVYYGAEHNERHRHAGTSAQQHSEHCLY